MHSVITPSTTLPSGRVVTTKLVLPAHWRAALVHGNATGLQPAERIVVATAQELFGYCTEVTNDAEFRDDHDVIGEGIPPTQCLTYTLCDHEGA